MFHMQYNELIRFLWNDKLLFEKQKKISYNDLTFCIKRRWTPIKNKKKEGKSNSKLSNYTTIANASW